ncbi:MAG: hypothetical protein LBF78_15700 [Treponema sp.]|jgi:hypothetical protein|nr:hypothetical protein [Treponema sp.]
MRKDFVIILAGWPPRYCNSSRKKGIFGIAYDKGGGVEIPVKSGSNGFIGIGNQNFQNSKKPVGYCLNDKL